MATLKPFAALRPQPELAKRICELPYDVYTSAEAAVVAQDNPYSFLHVSKPEIDLEPDIAPYDGAVYSKGAENFQLLQEQGALAQDATPSFYLYRQIMNGHAQVGLVAAASCAEYDEGIIKKHELTRPAKEDDRVRHIEALESQTGPVFLTYRAQTAIVEFVAKKTEGYPEVDFTAADGVQHSSWSITDDAGTAFIEAQFAAIDALYIADGHHRSAAASRVNAARSGAGNSSTFLSVIFPHNQIQVLPYNRAVHDLNGHSPEDFLKALGEIFEIEAGDGQCNASREVGLYLDGKWHGLTFRETHRQADSAAGALDVALLQDHVLSPLLGIEDPRTSSRIDFVGGIRGAGELERLVQEGRADCAFSLYPTSVSELMAIADAGELMPPKSTWFEPKLRDGMFCLMI